MKRFGQNERGGSHQRPGLERRSTLASKYLIDPRRSASFPPITPDMHLAIERRLGHGGAMAKDREPIDQLIDADVWMRRQEADI